MSSQLDNELGAVVAKIEDIVESLIEALAVEAVMEIPLRRRESGHRSLVKFPASSEKEVKKFTSLLLVLHICHEALVNDHLVTKRSIYYQDPRLFGNQKYVDRLVDDVAFTFGVSRDALNIVAAAKGLVVGSFTVTLKDSLVLNCDAGAKGMLIPRTRSIQRLDLGPTSWILVLEKEATFTSLAAARFHNTASAGRGILVTGKGYPDLATRQFLHFVHKSFPSVPMLVMVDYDPDGIAILGTYTSGSKGLSHEEGITVPSLIWLGPNSEDIVQMATSSRSESDALRLLTPTRADRRKATSLLRKLADTPSDDAQLTRIVRELQLMLILNVKSEIQMLDDEGQLANWLDGRLCDLLNDG